MRCPVCFHDLHDDLVDAVHAFEARFDRLERLIINEGKIIVSEIDDAATAIENAEAPLLADIARELGDLTSEAAGNLTDDQKARFQAIVDKLHQADADINTADPAPAAPPADGTQPPADGSGDGSTPTA